MQRKKVDHWICCDDDMAMCGEDVTGQEFTDDDINCPTCITLYRFPCRPSCDGEGYEDNKPYAQREAVTE